MRSATAVLELTAQMAVRSATMLLAPMSERFMMSALAALSAVLWVRSVTLALLALLLESATSKLPMVW